MVDEFFSVQFRVMKGYNLEWDGLGIKQCHSLYQSLEQLLLGGEGEQLGG